MVTTKTLLALILMDFHAAGTRGKLTKAFIAKWREQNPIYAGAKLSSRFQNGSAVAIHPVTRLDRATAAWIAAGNPAPSAPDFPSARFSKFVEAYRDEFDEDFYQ